MYIKVIDRNPIHAFKSEYSQKWAREKSTLINILALFLICLALLLGVFYTFEPISHEAQSWGLMISIVYVVISGFALLLIVRRRFVFWNAFKEFSKIIKTQKISYTYIITSTGITLELPAAKIETNWWAYENYNERDGFIVIIAKKDALVKTLWLNKLFIDEYDLSVLRKKLNDIFASM